MLFCCAWHAARISLNNRRSLFSILPQINKRERVDANADQNESLETDADSPIQAYFSKIQGLNNELKKLMNSRRKSTHKNFLIKEEENVKHFRYFLCIC